MPEENASAGSEQEPGRKERLAALLEQAKAQPGLAALLDVYQTDWFHLGTTIPWQPLRTSRTVRVSTDSLPALL